MSTRPVQARKPSKGIDRPDGPPFMTNQGEIGMDVVAAWAVVAGIFVLLFVLF